MMKNSGVRGGDASVIKYSAISTEKSNREVVITEKTPLLENMESLSISSPVKKRSPEVKTAQSDVKLCDKDTKSIHADDTTDTNENTQTSPQNKHSKDADRNKETHDKNSDTSSQGARPKSKETARSFQETSDGSKEKQADGSIDIVRKMSEPRSLNFIPWRLVGSYQTLKQKKCQRLFAATGRQDDLALFYHNGVFYVMEAWCTHMGGPLFEGDIEDYNGKCHVMCPWHSYMFDLETGMNEIGLQQKVHQLKLESGQIHVKYHTELTTESNRKQSMPSGPRIINRPPEGKHEKLRKQSVLDTPLKLA